MKSLGIRLRGWFFSFILLSLGLVVKGQSTDGTLTFTFTETVSGASKNVMAAWIEDNSGNFIKTKMRYWGNSTNDHLPTWVSKSNKNVVDATTGATLTGSTTPSAFGMKSITWDGKNVSNETVPDGTYQFFVETSWNNPEPGRNKHSDIISFTFEKNASSTHITPTSDDSHFSDITIDWVSAESTGIKDFTASNKSISVYPNPTNGLLKLNFENSYNVSRILIENTLGEIVYRETLNRTVSDNFPLDLSYLKSGIYFVEVIAKDNSNLLRSKFMINN